MIRTVVVPLTVIPGFAYRQKLPSGGSGIVVLRPESAQPGVCGISRSTGEPVPADNLPAGLFPTEAFREAVELTKGLPYASRGAVKLILGQPAEAPVLPEEHAQYHRFPDAFRIQPPDHAVDIRVFLFVEKRGKIAVYRGAVGKARQRRGVRLAQPSQHDARAFDARDLRKHPVHPIAPFYPL